MNTASNFPLQSAPRVLNKDCISANTAAEKSRSARIFPQGSVIPFSYETPRCPWWWPAPLATSLTIRLQTTFRTRKPLSSRHTYRGQAIRLHIALQQAQFEHDVCRCCKYWPIFCAYCARIGGISASECLVHRYIAHFLGHLFDFFEYTSTYLGSCSLWNMLFFRVILSFLSRLRIENKWRSKSSAIFLRYASGCVSTYSRLDQFGNFRFGTGYLEMRVLNRVI